MEAVGLVVGILPVLVKAIELCKSLKGARKNIESLLEELIALKENLTALDHFLASDALKAQAISFSPGSVLVKCSAACKDRLEKLYKQLEVANRGRLKRSLWITSEKEDRETAQQLRNFGLWIHLALSIEGCKLLSGTASAVSTAFSTQLDQLHNIQASIDKQTKSAEDNRHEQYRNKVLDWVSTFDYGENYRNASLSRVEGTGDWFLKEIASWRDHGSKSSILWCRGKLGAGKTVLASLIVDELQKPVSPSERPTAHFFFKSREHDNPSTAVVVSSILRQVLQGQSAMPQSLVDIHALYSRISKTLSINDCESILTDVLQNLPSSYMIFDAFDECHDQKQLIKTIERLRLIKNLRIMITSRDACPLAGVSLLEVEAQRQDIEMFIQHEIARSDMTDIDEDFVNTIKKAVLKQAHGMFLLPAIQLRTVLDEPSPGYMRDALSNLPGSLTEAFDVTIKRIRSLPGKRARIGMDTLMWVAKCRRTLTIAELQDALTIDRARKRFDKEYHAPISTIINCCQGLVVLDTDSGRLSFAHYSVREYFNNACSTLFPRAEAALTEVCIRYLLLDDFEHEDIPCKTQEITETKIKQYAFLSYAAQKWGAHAQHAESDPDVWPLIWTKLHDKRRTAFADQIRKFGKYHQGYTSVKETMSLTPLHTASRFGLKRAINDILQSRQFDVNAETAYLRSTPIIHAASCNQVDIMRLLLEHGANPLFDNWYGNALHCAAEAGCSEAIRLLVVETGMDPNDNACDSYPLRCAVDRDRVGAFKTLIELGASLQMSEPEMIILHQAVSRNAIKIVRWLVQNDKEDVNRQAIFEGRYMTSLHIAMAKEHFRMARVLIDLGADADMQDYASQTPFDYAGDLDPEMLETLLNIPKSGKTRMAYQSWKSRQERLHPEPDRVSNEKQERQ